MPVIIARISNPAHTSAALMGCHPRRHLRRQRGRRLIKSVPIMRRHHARMSDTVGAGPPMAATNAGNARGRIYRRPFVIDKLCELSYYMTHTHTHSPAAALAPFDIIYCNSTSAVRRPRVGNILRRRRRRHMRYRNIRISHAPPKLCHTLALHGFPPCRGDAAARVRINCNQNGVITTASTRATSAEPVARCPLRPGAEIRSIYFNFAC